jgi:phosphoribosylformylglycinamidine synthase
MCEKLLANTVIKRNTDRVEGMKSAVIVFPASNCDRDAKVALEQMTGKTPHMVWHQDSELPDVDLVVLPGGFSYGDYLRCGAMASQSAVMKSVRAHADKGGMVLGICNGFQVLTESHLLPGALMRNAALKFVCRPVGLESKKPNPPSPAMKTPARHLSGGPWRRQLFRR